LGIVAFCPLCGGRPRRWPQLPPSDRLALVLVSRDKGELSPQGVRVLIEFELSPTPDADWARIFTAEGGRYPEGYAHPSSMAQPELSGSRLSLYAPSGEISEYVGKLDERIDATNRVYERDVAPNRERERQAQDEQLADSERRLAGDQQALDELNEQRQHSE